MSFLSAQRKKFSISEKNRMNSQIFYLGHVRLGKLIYLVVRALLLYSDMGKFFSFVFV